VEGLKGKIGRDRSRGGKMQKTDGGVTHERWGKENKKIGVASMGGYSGSGDVEEEPVGGGRTVLKAKMEEAKGAAQGQQKKSGSCPVRSTADRKALGEVGGGDAGRPLGAWQSKWQT